MQDITGQKFVQQGLSLKHLMDDETLASIELCLKSKVVRWVTTLGNVKPSGVWLFQHVFQLIFPFY